MLWKYRLKKLCTLLCNYLYDVHLVISRAPANERVQLLKSFDEIKRMEDDCEEIEIGGLLKRYVERPPCLENVTLADWAAFYDNSRIEESNTRSRKKDVDGLLLEIKDEDNFEDEVWQMEKRKKE